MLHILIFVAAWLAFRDGPRLIAAAVAAMLAIFVLAQMAWTARRLHLVVDRGDVGAGFDRPVSRRQRQALRADLRAVLDYSQSVSLFPHIMLGARRFRSRR